MTPAASDAAAWAEPAACPLCDGPCQPTGDRCGDRPDIGVRRCEACGLVHLASFAHASTGHYGADTYFPADIAPIWEREEAWNLARIARLERELPRARERVVLDFGCGIGGFLRRAQERFGRVVGFDLSSRMVKLHREAGIVCHDRVDDLPGDIDTIVLFHVLEHVPRPWELLRELLVRFPRADRVVMEVPNGREVLVSLFDVPAYRANHYSADHLYYFDNATMRAVAGRAGLEVLVDDQMQRYPLGNTMGWIGEGRGGGQNRWRLFSDPAFHAAYERVLAGAGAADSVFLICAPAGEAVA